MRAIDGWPSRQGVHWPQASSAKNGARRAWQRALQAGGTAQRDGLRRVGDTSLFVSGFFSDSLNRGLVDVDYYMQLGERAYGSLARRDDTLGDVFDELADKFPAMVDVLTEVSERSALTSDADVMRLYERWIRTGSRRSSSQLVARGIVPNSSAVSRRLH